MANPFGYGNNTGFNRTQIGNTGLIPTEWLNEGLSFALPNTYFPRITPAMTEMQTGEKQNIVVPIDGEMLDSSWPSLVEGTSITVGSYNLDAVTVMVQEAGRGLEVERYVQQFLKSGQYPGRARNFARKLTNNLMLSWENELRSVYLNSKFGIRSVAAGSQTDVIDLTGNTTGPTGTLRQSLVDAALANLRQVHTGTLGTFIVPPYPDGLYHIVGNYNTLRGFFSDDDWKTLQTRNQSIGGRGLIVRDIGEFAGFRWIEHALMPDGTCIAHGQNVAVQAFGGLFSEDLGGKVQVQTVSGGVLPFQLRLNPDYQEDFGRRKAMAWYTVAGSSAAMRDIGTHSLLILAATP